MRAFAQVTLEGVLRLVLGFTSFRGGEPVSPVLDALFGNRTAAVPPLMAKWGTVAV
ncbi:MAG: hypothetical protein ACK535_14100 [Cyanobacteriota bacterium]